MKKIKLNIVLIITGAAAIVAAFLFGLMPIKAQAGGYECTCTHKCTKNNVNCDCPLCKLDHTLCWAEETDEDPKAGKTATALPDEPVIPTENHKDTVKSLPEEKEDEYGPLTPSGNMAIIDDYGAPSQRGKQFITVSTKNGNIFYIIVDRDDNGNETVHFLNKVDEADLLSLMDEDEVNEYIAVKTAAAGESAIKEKEVKEEPTPTEAPKEEEEPKKNSSGALVILLLIVIGAGAGYFFYTKNKSKKPRQEYEDPDLDYDESEEDYLESLPREIDDDMAPGSSSEGTDNNINTESEE